MTAFRRIILANASGATTPPGEDFSSYTLLSSLFPSMAQFEDLTIGSGAKILVDTVMADADALGQITVDAGGELRFDPRNATRLVCEGIDNSGTVKTDGVLGTSVHPYDWEIALCGAAPTVNGYSGGQRTALDATRISVGLSALGTAIARGYTHIGNTAVGNDGLLNDSGGLSRGFMNNAGGVVRLFAAGPQQCRLNAHWSTGTTITIDPPLTRAVPSGSKVLITPTSLFSSSRRTEERTTVGAAAIGATTLTLNAGPTYAHWGAKQYATDTGISLAAGSFTDCSTSRYTGSISGTTLAVTAVSVAGPISIGQRVFKSNDAPANSAGDVFITGFGTGTGGTGTYTVSRSTTLSSQTIIVKGMKTDAAQNALIDQRAAVAIMYSTGIIRGYDLGNTDLATFGFGFHGMSMGLTSETQIEGVRMIDYGQKGLLGRYAWHFHQPSYNSNGTIKTDGIAGNTTFSQTASPLGPNYPANKAIVRGCAFDEGHNRAFVFHACRGVVATDNIAYKSFGHAFFEEDGSDGHWFGNMRNRHVDNWSFDCPAHGWWNAAPVGYYSISTSMGGCTGFSVAVPIAPAHNRFNTSTWDAWSGNSSLACAQGGRTNSNPYTQQGLGRDFGYSPTSNDWIGTDIDFAVLSDGTYARGIPNQSATFIAPRFFKCGLYSGGVPIREAYHNRLNIGGYQYAVVSDNVGPTFNGSVQAGSFNDFPIGVGHSLNDESVSHVVFAASYHGSMRFRYGSFYNYSGDVPAVISGSNLVGHNTIKSSCVLDSWDLYTDPFHPWSKDFLDWRMLNSHGTYQTPALSLLNDVTSYDSILGGHVSEDWQAFQHNRHQVGIMYDHLGRFSQGANLSGRPGSHIVFNQPFFTTGLSDAVALEGNANSISTLTPYFAISFTGTLISPTPFNARSGDTLKGIYKAMTWRRLDSSLAAISGATYSARDTFYDNDQDLSGNNFGYNNGSGVSYYPLLWTSFFNGGKFAAWPNGAVAELTFPGSGDAANGKTDADYAYLTSCSGRIWHTSSAINPNANDATDYSYIVLPVKGSRTITSVVISGHTYGQVSGNTWANLQSTAVGNYKYFFDTANHRLVIKLNATSQVDNSYGDFSVTTS
jgi:hypothetical protein